VKFKVIGTADLITANKTSRRKRQNRTLSSNFLKRLDPDGVHVIGFTMHHVNFEGTPGIRARLYCKLTLRPDPAEVWFDFEPKDFQQLLEVEHEAVQQ
jgi:hypothetical protein